MTKTKRETMLFTPWNVEKGKRLRMKIIKTDIPRGTPWKKVIETTQGIKYMAWGADCGAEGCFCDAEVKLIPQEKQ